MIRLLLFSALALTSCAAEQSASISDVTNFKVGLVCPTGKTGTDADIAAGDICEVATTIPITGNSQCTYDQKRYPCTWYGFEFGYSDALAGQEVSCTGKSSDEGYYGNPETGADDASSVWQYSFVLDQKSRRFYNPQYTLYSDAVPKGLSSREDVTCSVNGKEILRYEIDILFE